MLRTRKGPPRSRSTLAAAAFVGTLAICLTWSGFKELHADTYRLLYSGRWIAHHGLLHREVFTLAGGNRYYADQQWLAELIDYETWRMAGYGGLALLATSVFGSAFVMLTTLLRRRGASVALAISCATLAIFGALSLTFIRAQIFAIPLFVGLLWLLLEDSDQDRLRWRVVLILPLLVLWANLHGSVLSGAGLAAAYFGCRAVSVARRGLWRSAIGYAGLAVAGAAMPIATPYGIHVLAYYHEMIGNRAVALADIEWAPPLFPTLSFFQFGLPLLVAFGSVMAATRRGRRPPWVLIGAVGLTGLVAAFAMRNNIWLGIAAAALIADTAPVWLPTAEVSRGFRRGLTWVAASMALLIAGLLLTRTSESFQAPTPLSAIAAVASYASLHPCARVLADNTSASALLWLDPEIAGRVGFDGELEAYPQAALVDWVTFQAAGAAGWLSAARGYQLLLGTATDHPTLVRRLGRLPGASILARDSRGIAVLEADAVTLGRCASRRGPINVAAAVTQ